MTSFSHSVFEKALTEDSTPIPIKNNTGIGGNWICMYKSLYIKYLIINRSEHIARMISTSEKLISMSGCTGSVGEINAILIKKGNAKREDNSPQSIIILDNTLNFII